MTGGAGFIGSRIVEMLLENGHEVICVDNLIGTQGSSQNIDHLRSNPNFHFHQEDFVDWIETQELDGVDTVFHQAASKMTVSLDNPERDLRVNALGTQRLVFSAVKGRVRKFILASTGSVYGDLIDRQDEVHPTKPNSLYGVSKLAGEGYTRAICRMEGLDFTILRYFHVIGCRQSDAPTGGVVPIFIRRSREGQDLVIDGSGEQIRSFTWVDDVARANLICSESPGASNQVFNCASGIRVSVRALAEYILGLSGSTVSIQHESERPGEVFNFDVVNEKIRSLGVVFRTDWQKVVRDVWDAYELANHSKNQSI